MRHMFPERDFPTDSISPFDRVCIDFQTVEAACLADMLDGLTAGLILVDEARRIVHANVAGHTMLKRADILRAAGGRLLANDPHANQTLADACAATGRGHAGPGVRGVALLLVARDGERYVAHVLPLTSGARRRAGSSYTAAAALLVHKAALDMPSPPEAIARAYRLTPMELRVLLAIVEASGVREVSAVLGIAETTVKTHLGRLYQKTGAGRQADLVKIVAGFANPFIK